MRAARAAVNPQDGNVLVACNSGTVAVFIVGRNGTLDMLQSVQIGQRVSGVAVNELPSYLTYVYVTNPEANTVSRLKPLNGTTDWFVSNSTPVGAAPSAVAVSRLTGTVYTANANSNTVSVINGTAITPTVTATIPVGSHPSAVAVNPVTGTIYVTNANSNTVSVING